MKLSGKTLIFLIIIAGVYITLGFLSLDSCYFWDNIQQTSKEAHWFYVTDFSSLLMPTIESGSEIMATGYHPPLMGLMTAMLWNIFGYKLWVSHAFVAFWAIILIYNTLKLSRLYFSEKYLGWVMLVVLLEPTILTQFYIASPDFILLTAFVTSLRAIIEKKHWLLTFGIFFLFGINMRGIFAGAILLITHAFFISYESSEKKTLGLYQKAFVPYVPTFILLAAYFSYYLFERGWFFSNSAYSDHYSKPEGISAIIKHFAAFGLRNIENGRIIIWTLGAVIAFKIFKSKIALEKNTKTILLALVLLNALYLLFVFITQMPFSSRYFMPQYFILSFLVMLAASQYLENKKTVVLFVVILIFEITGNCWIYPDKISKSWDATLAHTPYYELRKDCFNYIDSAKIDYNEISAGFSIYGNRQYIEMSNFNKKVSSGKNGNYFIYSNISNNEDDFVLELRNPLIWTPIKQFEKGVVNMIIYKRVKQAANQ